MGRPFYESIETPGAFFVDFLKSISSNKGQSQTEKIQRKIKSGKKSILELFYMYVIFGGFATQKLEIVIFLDHDVLKSSSLVRPILQA